MCGYYLNDLFASLISSPSSSVGIVLFSIAKLAAAVAAWYGMACKSSIAAAEA